MLLPLRINRVSGKIGFSLSLLFFIGCATSSPWKLTGLPNADPDYEIVRLSYPATDALHGMKLEFVRYGTECYAYIHAAGYAFPFYQGKENQAKVSFYTERTAMHFIAFRCEDGQRLRLTEEAAAALATSLKKGESVTLSCGHFSQSVSASYFCRAYRTLYKRPARFVSKERVHVAFY